MAYLTGGKVISSADLYTSYTTLPGGYELGEFVWGSNGRGYRLVLAGGVALVTGNLLQESAEDTQFENMAVLAAAIGATTVTVTNGTTTVSANQFDGGSVSVYTAGSALLGEEYTIVGHSTGGSGAALTLYLDRPIRTAWSTSTKVNMKRSLYSGVIQAPATTQTGVPVGVAVFAIPAAAYGWIQTKGQAAVLSDGSTFAVGSDVGTPSGTAGCVTVFAAGTTHTSVGVVRQAAASGHDITLMLRLD